MSFDDRDLYDANYFLDRGYGRDPRRERSYHQEQSRIVQRVNFGDILDVGCGLGVFLKAADDRWRKYGVEPASYAEDIARKNGLTMFHNLHAVQTETMDVVVMRGVLQHMNTPLEDLFQAARALRKGGVLAILATPDADGIVYRIWHRLPALDAPRNWIVFGSHELENILERLGFSDIEILHPYWRTPYASPFKDACSFVLSVLFGWRPFPFPGSMMEVYARKA